MVGASLLLMVLFTAHFLVEQRTPIDEVRQATGIPDGIAVALIDAFPEDRCVLQGAATIELRQRLDRAGFADWKIQAESPMPRHACVGWSVDPLEKTIGLVAALSPEVREALKRLPDEMMETCFSERDAVAYVSSALRNQGMRDFEVRTDGPVGIPLDRGDEVLRHLEAGCWIFSAMGWKDGRPVFFVGST